jgi:hypothetical protein
VGHKVLVETLLIWIVPDNAKAQELKEQLDELLPLLDVLVQ